MYFFTSMKYNILFYFVYKYIMLYVIAELIDSIYIYSQFIYHDDL